MVVSPDLGNAKEAAAFARLLGVPVAAGAKQRFSDDIVRISAIIGEIRDRDVIVLDDEIAKGSTVIELLSICVNVGPDRCGWRAPMACSAPVRSNGSPSRRMCWRSYARTPCRWHRNGRYHKLTVLSVAPALAEAMRRIHNGESVSALFEA